MAAENHDYSAEEVAEVVHQVRGTASDTASGIVRTDEDTAAALAQTVLDTAEGVRITAESTAADLATLVKDTAAILRATTEETARIVKEAAEVNANFSPLLVKSLDVIAVTVAQLNVNSKLLRDQAKSETDLLTGRTKYFMMLIAMSGVNIVFVLLVLGLVVVTM